MRMSRRIAIHSGVKRFWVFDGNNGGFKLDGGYSGQRYTVTSTEITFTTPNAENSRANWYPNAAIDITKYKKMCFVVTSATSGQIELEYRRGGIADATNKTPTTYATISENISTATKYEVDLSSIVGNQYINFVMNPKSNQSSSASTTVVTQIWLQ